MTDKIEARLDRLESQNKRQRLAIIGLLLCMLSVGLISASSLIQEQGSKNLTLKKLTVDRIEAKEILLEGKTASKEKEGEFLYSKTWITPDSYELTQRFTRYETLYSGKTMGERLEDFSRIMHGEKLKVPKVGKSKITRVPLGTYQKSYIATPGSVKLSLRILGEPGKPIRLQKRSVSKLEASGLRVTNISGNEMSLTSSTIRLHDKHYKGGVVIGKFTHDTKQSAPKGPPLGTLRLFNDQGIVTFQAPGK